MSPEKNQMISEYLAQLNRRLQVVENRLGINDAWGEDVKTKKLDCGLEITMEDYHEIDEDGSKKTEFTFDEALKIEKKTGGKWRMPTIKEWLQIVLELGTTEDGSFDRDKFVKELNLTEDKDGYGFYWSSTVSSSGLAYYLSYNSSVLYPAYRRIRYRGRSVRLVKGDEK